MSKKEGALNDWPAACSDARLCIRRRRRLDRLNHRIAHLMAAGGRWVPLAQKRLRLARVTAYRLALASEREPHWWRDLSFVAMATSDDLPAPSLKRSAL